MHGVGTLGDRMMNFLQFACARSNMINIDDNSPFLCTAINAIYVHNCKAARCAWSTEKALALAICVVNSSSIRSSLSCCAMPTAHLQRFTSSGAELASVIGANVLRSVERGSKSRQFTIEGLRTRRR